MKKEQARKTPIGENKNRVKIRGIYVENHKNAVIGNSYMTCLSYQK